MNCLVTGIGGFVASHVADELLSIGHTVVGLDNLSVGEYKNVPIGVKFIPGDIRDEEIVSQALRGVDTVFHFAYDATECKSIFSPVLDTSVNLVGSMVLLKEMINLGIKRMVFSSSVLAYGKPKYLPMDEKHPLNPDDPYSISKVAFERYLSVYHDLGVIEPYIVRFNNTYGTRLRLDNPYKGVVQIFISQCLRNKPITVYGDGKQSRAMTFIEDIKKPIVDVLNYPELINNPINIGSDFIYTIEEVAKEVIKQINPEIKINYLPKREKDIEHAYADPTYMNKLMNYKCTTKLEEGIRKTIKWARTEDLNFKYNWPVEIPKLLDKRYREKKL